ncbi:hypothetical protein J2S74_002938 [Evansella vedderi]|uniref:Uncharacterized protein n=1 Tax=Evansella vedderi TaxID=38282 RepID=A0ABT9ZWF7_9BACI|nr:hypothetical protein [Evansella vedderi]MDQ0255556.1 hypothetical protein [Evansella vedderi]
MKADLNKFFLRVSELSVREEKVEPVESAMNVLYIACYSAQSNVGEVDFSSFDLSDVDRAMDELVSYESDDCTDDELTNIDNLLTEINRKAHLKNIADYDLKPRKKKRRFF